jgi:hypothetical protein
MGVLPVTSVAAPLPPSVAAPVTVAGASVSPGPPCLCFPPPCPCCPSPSPPRHHVARLVARVRVEGIFRDWEMSGPAPRPFS